MTKRSLIPIAILMLGVDLAAFPQAQPQKPPEKPPAGAPTAPPAPPEEPPPVLAVPKDYRYNARGRRDPFVNPVPKPKTEAAATPPQVVRPPGLKGVLVAEANIVGVVTSKEPSMNLVILSAPGAKAPYFARVGDQLYDAVVKSINLDSVTFALTAPGGANDRAPREIVRKVRPTPGEPK